MKKAFTLIEVMVVIVILGVLATVGMPKLFGMIAKAKASEVPVAAGAYTKLQDAFIAEKTVIGTWNNIGYIAPNGGKTNNFCYSQGNITDTVSTENIGTGIIGWGATNVVSLNDCGATSWWSILITADGSNSVNYAKNLSYEPCVALTKDWTFGGTTLSGTCENAKDVPVKVEEKPKDEKVQEKVEEKPEEKTEETVDPTPTPQQSYDECYNQCYEERKHNGKNEHGIEQSCQNQCKNK